MPGLKSAKPTYSNSSTGKPWTWAARTRANGDRSAKLWAGSFANADALKHSALGQALAGIAVRALRLTESHARSG